MALHSDSSSYARIVYTLSGAGLTGSATIGMLPAGYKIFRGVVLTHVAGTGSSSPTIAIGISGTTGKYVAAQSPGVDANVDSLTIIGTSAPTADETILITYGGTMPTNAAYSATLVLELIRV